MTHRHPGAPQGHFLRVRRNDGIIEICLKYAPFWTEPYYFEKRSIVEIGSAEEALTLIEQGCDVLQLEKLSIDEVIQVVTAAKHSTSQTKPVISAAGGVNLENVADYAATGVDVLVTSAPFFAKPRDVQVRFAVADQLSD
jgi:nicotinate-nucleotide pyrophosphorylase